MAIISEWGPTFHVELEVKINSMEPRWRSNESDYMSLIHLGNSEFVPHPALSFQISKKRIKAYLTRNTDPHGIHKKPAETVDAFSPRIKLNKFYKWKLSKTKDSSGQVSKIILKRSHGGGTCFVSQYWFEVKLNGVSLQKRKTWGGRPLRDVRLYAGLATCDSCGGHHLAGIPDGEYRNVVFGN